MYLRIWNGENTFEGGDLQSQRGLLLANTFNRESRIWENGRLTPNYTKKEKSTLISRMENPAIGSSLSLKRGSDGKQGHGDMTPNSLEGECHGQRNKRWKNSLDRKGDLEEGSKEGTRKSLVMVSFI